MVRRRDGSQADRTAIELCEVCSGDEDLPVPGDGHAGTGGRDLDPVPFALVCFRACPAGVDDLDSLNEQLMNGINASGDAYLSHTKLGGKYILRLSVGSIRVEERHLKKVWDILNERLHIR